MRLWFWKEREPEQPEERFPVKIRMADGVVLKSAGPGMTTTDLTKISSAMGSGMGFVMAGKQVINPAYVQAIYRDDPESEEKE